MFYNRSILVLPCYGLDDFPESLADDLAADFLGAWSSLWHPKLLQMTGTIPEWKRADSGSLDVENALVLVPQCALHKLEVPLRERLAVHQCLLVDSQGNRAATLSQLCTSIRAEATLPEDDAAQLELASSPVEFFALGYAYLQIQLLTRRLRYSSNLNQPLFTEQAIEAAKAYLDGNQEECQRWLQSCFDQLSQERDHYYSQSAYLVDITLLAPSTLGAKFREQLQNGRITHVLASAHLLRSMKSGHAESFDLLRSQLASERVQLVGGLDEERWTSWMTPLQLHRYFEQGLQSYRDLELPRPQVFARYSQGMQAEIPMQLLPFEYQGALLFDWEQGAYPSGNQAKITWEAADGSGLDAIADYVLDASSPSSFLAIGSKLGAQLDHHQVPTITLAHWPMGTCEAFEDFLVAVQKTPALGVWTGLHEYFSTTQRPYHQERIAPSKFPKDSTPVTAKLLADWKEQIKREQDAVQQCLNEQIASWLKASSPAQARREYPLEVSRDSKGPTIRAIETMDSNSGDSLSTMEVLGKVLPRTSQPPQTAWLLANSLGGPRRVGLELSANLSADPDKRIYAAERDGDTTDLVVDLPPMGLLRLEESSGSSARKKGAVIGSNVGVLGNEFIEGHIDPQSGKVSALYIAKRRGNRMSGMLAVRLHEKIDGESYSKMVAGQYTVTRSNTVRGKIQVRGRCMVGKQELGKFEITYQLWRGSRILEIDLKVFNLASRLTSNDAVVWRTAWPNETSSLATWHQGIKQPFSGKRGLCPLLVEIDEAEHKGYVLTGGNPLQFRASDRFLDTELLRHDDGTIHAQIGLAIDLPRPYQSALEWIVPPLISPEKASPLSCGNAAWFIQSSVSNVTLSPYRSLIDESGKVVGMRAWLMETGNRGCSAKIECFRTPVQADRVACSGRSLGKIDIEGDTLVVHVRPNEQSLIDIYWP